MAHEVAVPRAWCGGALVLTALLGAACSNPVDTPRVSQRVEDTRDPVIEGLTTYVMSDGVRQGRINADTAHLVGDSSDEYVLVGMHVIFYDPIGRERATVKADSGRMNVSTQSMVALGHVLLIITADRRKIESAELHYDPSRDRLWSDSATVMTESNGVVTRGSSFDSDLEFKHPTIHDIRGGGIVF